MSHTDLQVFLTDTAALGRATTLFRENGLRAFLLHLNAGEQLPEHRTPGAIAVQCLRGEATFSTAEESVTLKPASLISVAPGLAHSVVALQDTLFLITVSEQFRAQAE